jgi:hypothetical protein
MSGTTIVSRQLDQSASYPTLGRNRIINGEVRINQENGLGGTTNSSTSGESRSVDTFSHDGTSAAGTYSVLQASATPPTGFSNYLRATTTGASASPAATASYRIFTKLEGFGVRDFLLGTAQAKTITLSFWVRSSLTGIFSGGFVNSANNRSYPFNYTILSAATWEYKTVTLTGDITGTWLSDTGIGLRIIWDLGSGSNFEGTLNTWIGALNYRTAGAVRLISTNAATLDITGIQLEIGAGATQFEYRPFQMEIDLCQRYYEKGYDIDVPTAANNVTASWSATFGIMGTNHIQSHSFCFKVIKRATPVMTFWTPDGATVGSWLFYSTGGTQTNRAVAGNHVNTASFDVDNSTSSADIYAQGQWVADARL